MCLMVQSQRLTGRSSGRSGAAGGQQAAAESRGPATAAAAPGPGLAAPGAHWGKWESYPAEHRENCSAFATHMACLPEWLWYGGRFSLSP